MRMMYGDVSPVNLAEAASFHVGIYDDKLTCISMLARGSGKGPSLLHCGIFPHGFSRVDHGSC